MAMMISIFFFFMFNLKACTFGCLNSNKNDILTLSYDYKFIDNAFFSKKASIL